MIARLKDAAQLPLPELVEHILDLSGLRAHYLTEKEGQDRLANLDELINAATSFIAEEGRVNEEGEITSDLASFLAHAALEAGEHQSGEGEDALQLMTVHSAKGLEFNVVFVSGLEAGLFPHENSVAEEKGLEEERRLMYVAVTRARQRLYLSFAQTRMLHGQTRFNLPSRFIDEIPDELLKWLTPKVGRRGFVSESTPPWGDPSHSSGAHGGLRSSGQFAAIRTPTDRDNGLRIGQSVKHGRFGHGVIVNAEGGGTDARVQVNFGHAGMKWLALSVAKLEPA